MKTTRRGTIAATAGVAAVLAAAGTARAQVTVTERQAPPPAPAPTDTIPAAPPAPTPGINVTINGEPIPFAGQAPVQRGSAILVPLRGVFERLGAAVQYDPENKTIVATKGQRTITLRVGDSVATVDGKQQTLSAPAAAENGATLVPLRFVSEALGAAVKWDAALRTVRITTDGTTPAVTPTDETPVVTIEPAAPQQTPARPEPAAPAPQTPAGKGPMTGSVLAALPDALTLRLPDGRTARVGLSDDPVVLVQAGSGPSVRGALSDLRVGDLVTVRRDAGTGRATVVEARFEERTGEVKVVQDLPTTGARLLTLGDGQVVEVMKEAPVTSGGKPADAAALAAGANVTVRVNPQTGLGTAVAVAAPAKPAPDVPAMTLQVSSLTLSPAGRPLRGGEQVTVTLRGTPGAAGTFTVPGLAGAENGVPLKETEPGVYVGTLTAPSDASLKGAAILASLTKDGAASNTIQAAQTLTIDGAGPVLANLSPAQGSEQGDGRPLIYGTYTDVGSGVDPKGVRLTVNGQDVTADATVTDAFFSYRPAAELPAGETAVVVTVKDGAGNETKQAWKFAVTPASSVIRSVAVSPADETLGAGDALTVRIAAPAGGKASFSVGGAIVDQPMTEEAPGDYAGTYEVKKGDSVTKAPVTVAFTAKGAGKPVTKTAGQSVTIAAGSPGTPVIDAPTEGASVGATVVLSGRAAPGATVRLSIRYSGKLLVVGTGGNVVSTEVKAGKDGRWKTAPIKLPSPKGVSGLSFTLQATTVGQDGEESAPATVRFKR
jgi:hypothetical protein